MTPAEEVELKNKKASIRRVEWLSEKVNLYSKEVIAGFLVRILADNFQGQYKNIFSEMDLVQEELKAEAEGN